MAGLKVKILTELDKAKRNSIECGKNENDVPLVVLAFLKYVNSGQVEGEFKVRINGHIVTTPRLDGLKISLDKIEHQVVIG